MSCCATEFRSPFASRTAARRPSSLPSSTGTNPSNNDFLLVSQLWIKSDLYERRTDLLGFVNGIPLVFIELKAAHRNLEHAYDDNLTRLPRHDPAALRAERRS